MRVSLNWLLTTSGLKNIKCVTCEEQLEVKFDSISVLDNPKSIRWIKQDELVISSGYFLSTDEEKLRAIVRDLKEAGCVALGLKIKGYFNEIPEEMIDEANKVGLVLLEIPYYYSLGEFSQTVYNYIFEMNYQVRINEQRLIEDISDIFFSKRGVMEMLYRMAEFFKRTVILVDNDFRCIYAAKRMADKKVCYRDSKIKKIEDNDENRGLFEFSDNIQRQAYYALVPGKEANTCVLVLEDGGKLRSDEKNLIERCIKIVSMGLEQVRSKREFNYEYEDEHYKELFEYLDGLKKYTQEEVMNIIKEVNLPYEKKRITLQVQIKETEQLDNNYKELIEESIQSCKEAKQMESCVLHRNGKVIVYLFTDSRESDPDAVFLAMSIAKEIVKSISTIKGVKIKIGMSKCSSGCTRIKRDYQDAGKVINIAEKLDLDGELFTYNQLAFYDYLIQYQNQTKEQCYNQILYLLQYDKENKTEYAQTLLRFLECKFNISDTAKALYVHRNTLMNRLAKLKELLHNDLETMDDLMPLCVEACAYKLYKKEKE